MAGNSEAVRQEVAMEVLAILRNTCRMPRLIKRDYQKYFEDPNHKIGTSLDIPRPIRAIGADGQALQPEGLVRTTVPFTIAYWSQEAFVWNDIDEAAYLREDMRENYVKPHAVNLANKVDRQMMQYISSITPNFVGTPGTPPTTRLQYSQAQTKLNQLLAAEKDRFVVFNSSYSQNLIQADAPLFNPKDIISDEYRLGRVGMYADMQFWRDEQIPTGNVGTYAGSGVVNGANQTGTSILTNGWNSGSLALSQTAGFSDRVTFAGCYEINGQSRLAIPNTLKQFAVVAPVTDSTGAATLTIFPGIIPSGPYQNCSVSPTASGAVTVAGVSGATAQTAFAMAPSAFTWGALRLQNTSEYGAKCTLMTDEETGISIRITQQWDNVIGQVTLRMDFVWGISQTYADYESVVIYG